MLNERTTELQWPDYYPENCPPEAAKSASGTVYRLVQSDPPQSEDFIPLYIDKPENFERKPISEVCQGCGVSVCKDKQDIERLQSSSGKMRKRHIAEGELNPTLGVIKHTPSRKYKSHHTWWVPIGIKPWVVFHVVNDSRTDSNSEGI